jgi:hypothetical protein
LRKRWIFDSLSLEDSGFSNSIFQHNVLKNFVE